MVQVAETYEQQLDDRESAFVTLQAAFREDYSNDHVAKELERLATAAGKWNELISDYTQVVQGISDPQAGRGSVGEDRPLVRLGARPHVDYAIASAQQALAAGSRRTSARCIGAGGLLPQAEAVARAGGGAGPSRRGARQEPQPSVDILLQLADTYETQLGDAAQATAAYQQALDTDERCMDAIDALERLYRRTQAWDRLVEVLTKKSQIVDDGELAVRLRLQVGELWEERLGDNDRAVEAYKEVLTVDPQNLAALIALERSTRRPGKHGGATSTSSSTSSRCTGPRTSRVSIYQQHGGDLGGAVRQDRSGHRLPAEDPAHRRSQRRRPTATSSGSTADERKWDALVDNYRKPHHGVGRIGTSGPSCTSQMGQVYEEELQDPDRAIEAYNDVLSFEPDHVEALRGLARLYEETEQWERAVEVMRRLIRWSTTRRRSTSTTASARSSTSTCGCRRPPRSA